MDNTNKTYQLETIDIHSSSVVKDDPIGNELFPPITPKYDEAKPALKDELKLKDKDKDLEELIDDRPKKIQRKVVKYETHVMNTIKGLHQKSYYGNRRLSWDQWFMVQAYVASLRSTCKKLHVGAVFVSKDKRILSSGYNGFPAGCPHVSHERNGHEIRTIHAEQNAISYAARKGIAIEGSCVYVTHFPCINCTKVILAAGVREVVYGEDYKNDKEATQLFLEMGVRVRKFDT